MTKRPKFIAGNWKMYTTAAEARALATAITRGVGGDQRVMAADPHGMSGCGIWRMAPGRTDGSPATEPARLVGVAYGYNRTLAIIRGTRIGIYLEMLRQELL